MIPKISTDLIERDVTAGEPVSITHSLGRQISGWLVVWKSTAVDFHVADPAADTRQELILIPNASARVRLLLL